MAACEGPEGDEWEGRGGAGRSSDEGRSVLGDRGAVTADGLSWSGETSQFAPPP